MQHIYVLQILSPGPLVTMATRPAPQHALAPIAHRVVFISAPPIQAAQLQVRVLWHFYWDLGFGMPLAILYRLLISRHWRFQLLLQRNLDMAAQQWEIWMQSAEAISSGARDKPDIQAVFQRGLTALRGLTQVWKNQIHQVIIYFWVLFSVPFYT